MTGSGRRNLWLRMTDSMGLTEAGKKPAMPGPRLLLFQVVVWSVGTLVWVVTVIRAQGRDAQILYGFLAVLSLVSAVGNFVMFRRAKKGMGNSAAGGQANRPTR